MIPHVISMADAAEGLAFEHALFEGEGFQIGFWTSACNGLVCPRAYASRSGFDAAAGLSADMTWPVHLRPTGGGTVPQGPGIDNISIAFDALRGISIDAVYRLLTQVIVRGLGQSQASLATGATTGSFCDGAWNLSACNRKIVGTAQRWRPQKNGQVRVLAHAMVLTKQTFHRGAEAVARLHAELGLDPVLTQAHTSLEAAFGITRLPAEAIHDAAQEFLAPITLSNE